MAFREAPAEDGWRTLREGTGWEEAGWAGIDLGLVFLTRDGFKLALEKADAVSEEGCLAHVCLDVDTDELDRLRARVRETDGLLLLDRPGCLIFADTFGLTWEVTDHVLRSNGAGRGRWLDVTPKST